MRNRKSFRERYNKNVVDDRAIDTNVRSNHYLYSECTGMHMMADLSRKDEPTTIGSTDSETPLCRVTYDKARKLLTINPDFTIDGEQHYNVTNSYGVKFNYRIEHVSEGRTPLELQEHREDARRVSMQLFMTRTIGIPNFRVTGVRADQKTVFSWKDQSRHSRATSVYLPRNAVTLISDNSFRSDSFLSFSLSFSSLLSTSI